MWLCMADPSNNPDHPGWPLRNMLLLAAKQWQASELSVLCVRDHRGKLDAKRSLFLHVNLPHIPTGDLYQHNVARVMQRQCCARLKGNSRWMHAIHCL